MATLDWKSSDIFEFLQRQIREYNSNYNLKDICVANQAAPSSPVINDVYYYTGDVSATVFGVNGVLPGSIMVYSTFWISKVLNLNDLFKDQIERLKYQNIETSNRGIVKIKELYDLRVAVTTSRNVVWSKFGFWSWAIAKKDMLVDEIGVHVTSLTALTGDLRVKIFVDGILVADLTKLNANLGAVTTSGNIEIIDIGKRLLIKNGQIIAVGWEISNSEKIQLSYCTTAVDGTFEFGLNQSFTEAADGSIISASVPITTPSSGTWYLPFYFNSYKVYDKSNPMGFASQTELTNHESLEIHKTKFEYSNNALNKKTETPDKYIDSGNLLDATPIGTWATSDYIAWGANTQLVTGLNGGLYNYHSVSQFDVNKQYIAGTTTVALHVSSLAKASGAVYFRISYNKALNQVNFGNTILPYVAYSKTVKQDTDGNEIKFHPDMADESLVAKFAVIDNNFTASDLKTILTSKNGGTAYNIYDRIKPNGTNLWVANDAYTKKWHSIWYKGVSHKIINRISVPLVKSFYNNSNFTDGITIKVFIRGLLYFTKVIPFSDVSPFNSLLSTSPLNSFFYDIDLPVFEINTDDVIYVGVECNAPSDKIAMIFKMNTPSNASEWSMNYGACGDDSNHVINLTTQPAIPSSESFFREIRFYFIDYIGKQIDDKISGTGNRTDLSLLVPKKIYNVFNDLKGTGNTDLFNVRFHSATLFFDHLVKGITEDLDMDFAETVNEKFNFFAPEITTDTSTVTKSIAFNPGSKYNGGTISVIQKNVKESVGATKFPKILVIGDSVTSGTLANVGNKDGLPNTYWAVIKEQFEQARIDAGDNPSLHNCLMVGHYSSNSWSMTYGSATNRSMKAYAEGFGGWSSTSHMYWSRNWGTRAQGLWDLLGLGNGTGTDWTGSAAQQLSMFTTPEGYLTPKDTAAFLAYINSELGLSLTTYSDAVNALNAKENDPENPFYDKTTAAGGVIAFNLTKYLNRYKTLDNDGKTRLVVGSTSGTKVTNVNAYDVCLPTHFIIQHSHNDGNVAWFADNIRKWTDAIKAEYSANGWAVPFIGISVIRHTGTYYPKRYPMFDRASIALWLSEPSTGYDNTQKIMNKFWVSDANEDTERIYILPSMHVQPPAWGISYRAVNTPEFDITGLSQHMYRILYGGAGPTYHPNSIAHRCWGMQMYAWVRYTLSL